MASLNPSRLPGWRTAARLLSVIVAILALLPLEIRAQESTSSPGPSAQEQSSPGGETPEGSAPPADSATYRLIKFTGKFHLLVLHFPIAFLLAAALVQWCQVASGRGGTAVSLLLWFGAAGAIAAAALGWMYAYDSVYFGDDEQLLFWHRWLGTGTAGVSTAVLLMKNRLSGKALALVLTLCAVLVAATAHFGASLVYGADFLKKF